MSQDDGGKLDGPARRTVLKLGATALGIGVAARAGLFGDAPPAGAQGVPPGDEILTHAGGFSVEIDGAPAASGRVRSVYGLEVLLDERKPKPNFKKAVLGPLRLAFDTPADEITQWWNDTKSGTCIRKNITINLRRADGTTARQIVCHDSLPTQWSSVNFDTSSTVQTETLTVKIGRIEFKT